MKTRNIIAACALLACGAFAQGVGGSTPGVGGQSTTLTSLTLTAQTAAITTATLYAVPASRAGLYRVTYDLIVTTVGTGGTGTVTIGWTNGTAANTAVSASANLQTLGVEVAGSVVVYSALSQNITYAVALPGATGTPAYSVQLRVEAL